MVLEAGGRGRGVGRKGGEGRETEVEGCVCAEPFWDCETSRYSPTPGVAEAGRLGRVDHSTCKSSTD